jgi:hypothetical protein
MEPFAKPAPSVMAKVDVPEATEAMETASACHPKPPATINACPKALSAVETDDTAWQDTLALTPASTVLLAATVVATLPSLLLT